LELKPVLLKHLLKPLKQLISTYPKSAEIQVCFDYEPMENIAVMANQVALHQVFEYIFSF
jgi:hypothetical protein